MDDDCVSLQWPEKLDETKIYRERTLVASFSKTLKSEVLGHSNPNHALKGSLSHRVHEAPPRSHRRVPRFQQGSFPPEKNAIGTQSARLAPRRLDNLNTSECRLPLRILAVFMDPPTFQNLLNLVELVQAQTIFLLMEKRSVSHHSTITRPSFFVI